MVAVDGKILGKPKDREDAFNMLKLLSGKSHSVFTGVTVISPKGEKSFFAETKVKFFDLSDEELAAMHVFAKHVALAIQKAFPCKKVGEAVIGLEVPHAHIHLIPIQKESDMLFSNPKLKLSDEEFVEIARAINEAWKQNKQ